MKLEDRLSTFLMRYEKAINLAAKKEQALIIDYKDIDAFDPKIADDLLQKPLEILDTMKKVINDMDIEGVRKVFPRIKNLPESQNVRIRNLRSEHLNHFLTIEGVVKTATEVKPQIFEAIFECPDCGKELRVVQTEKTLRYPSICDCGRRGRFRLKDKLLFDSRWLKIAEPFEIASAERPGEIRVYLKEDLTSPQMQRKTDPGARLKINGILREMIIKVSGKTSTQLDMFLEANYVESTEVEFEEIEITKEDEKKIKALAKSKDVYEKLRDSISPSIYGFEEVKEAILLQMFGGCRHVLPDGTTIRGDIHILLTGDPSVGKTQLLKLVSKSLPRGKYVSGKGVSAAGLCTTYDSLIFLEDGSLIKIGDLVEKELKKGKRKDGNVIVAAEPTERKILAFDEKTLKIVPLKISQYWKLKSPKKLIKIRMRSGKEVRVTEENPIPVFEDGKIIWKRAKDLNRGDYIATPRRIDFEPSRKSIYDWIDKSAHILNASETVLNLVKKIKEKETVRDFSKKFNFGENNLYHSWIKTRSPSLYNLEKISQELGVDLENILPDELQLSQKKGHVITLPKYLNEDFMYLVGLICGDGSVSKTGFGGLSIKFCSNDDELLNEFQNLSKVVLKINPRYYKHPERIPYYTFNSKIFGNILEKLGVPDGKKSNRIRITEELSKLPNSLLSSYLQGVFDTDGSVVIREKGSSCVDLTTTSKEFAKGLQLMLLRFGILSTMRRRKGSRSMIRERDVVSKTKYVVEIRGLENLEKFKEKIGFRFSKKRKKLESLIKRINKYDTNVDVIPGLSKILREARRKTGKSGKDFYGYKTYSWEKWKDKISKRKLQELCLKNKIPQLNKFAYSDIFFDSVKDLSVVDSGEDFVYDVTVEGAHSFVANGIVIHNTATVRKEEELMGGWVLEAGALVLCNGGVIAIDEFDKISPEDQVAMHEAMSVQTISIAKASIVATLPAQTAILAGANPKLGRFDPYVSIIEQIDIPETLMSRFDLKFALRDIPSREKDERLAEHVLTSRIKPKEVKPILEPDFIRKYVVYVKKKGIEPKLTKQAANILKDFYVNMRNMYSGEEVPTVAITLRQYEAMIRLAEASAKIRLSDKVTAEDAKRAIRLMSYSLRQLGYDIESGKIDIDKLESGITTKQRSRIRIILDIVERLESELAGKEIPEEDVIAAAVEEGVDDKTAEDIIRRLKTQGMLFEPRSGFLRRV